PAMVAAVSRQLQLVAVNLRIGRGSSIGPRAMVAAVISELEANRRIGRMRSIVGLRGRRSQVIGSMLQRVVLRDGGQIDVRVGAPVMAVIRWGRLHRRVFIVCRAGEGAAGISEIGGSRFD